MSRLDASLRPLATRLEWASERMSEFLPVCGCRRSSDLSATALDLGCTSLVLLFLVVNPTAQVRRKRSEEIPPLLLRSLRILLLIARSRSHPQLDQLLLDGHDVLLSLVNLADNSD